MRIAWAVPIFIALAASAAARDGSLVGYWYMEGVENQLRVQFIIHNKSDGTFSKEVRDITDCSAPRDSTETGTWTFVDGQYGEITRAVDGLPTDPAMPFYHDSFTIRWTDDNHISMYDPKTRVTWHPERVAPQFRMPVSTGCTV